MAYMSQAKKKELAPAIKALCKEFNVKSTISVRNHSTLEINIKSGELDFLSQYNAFHKDRNEREFGKDWSAADNISISRVDDRMYSGKELEFLSRLIMCANANNHDNSDIMTDYFDVGWYVSINVGQWDKPYILNKM